MYDFFLYGITFNLNVSQVCNDSHLVDRWFFNCFWPCQHFCKMFNLIAVSHYHVYVMYSIIHHAIHVVVACDFYSNGRPLVALTTSFALVTYFNELFHR